MADNALFQPCIAVITSSLGMIKCRMSCWKVAPAGKRRGQVDQLVTVRVFTRSAPAQLCEYQCEKFRALGVFLRGARHTHRARAKTITKFAHAHVLRAVSFTAEICRSVFIYFCISQKVPSGSSALVDGSCFCCCCSDGPRCALRWLCTQKKKNRSFFFSCSFVR